MSWLGFGPAKTERNEMAKGKCRTVVDTTTQTMRCSECGDEVPIPLGVISWVTAVMNAFDEVHHDCRHEPGRTRFSKPNVQGQP